MPFDLNNNPTHSGALISKVSFQLKLTAFLRNVLKCQVTHLTGHFSIEFSVHNQTRLTQIESVKLLISIALYEIYAKVIQLQLDPGRHWTENANRWRSLPLAVSMNFRKLWSDPLLHLLTKLQCGLSIGMTWPKV